MNTTKGAASKTGHIPDLGRPPIIKRDTFEDILADAKVQMTPHRWVQFAHMALSTPILRPIEHLEDRTPHLGASQVPSLNQGLFRHPDLQKDLFEEGFCCGLQVVATEFWKLGEPKVAKLKGGYSSDASLMFKSWLKDIWVYVLECHLSQWKAIQLVKDYTSKHAWLKVEYHLGLTPKSEVLSGTDRSSQPHISILQDCQFPDRGFLQLVSEGLRDQGYVCR